MELLDDWFLDWNGRHEPPLEGGAAPRILTGSHLNMLLWDWRVSYGSSRPPIMHDVI